ncbi:hypothetical protein E4L95_16765 [Paracoccus liaowanqingii]|uniref:Uncharacterized protein n=1 Tax=Paracoccus liaowanqingii TaxID=2560053 RepID=A0A4Z1C8J7_9RHOB|nr:hypothetical protein [Paracoccus liaowanqingii]TGN51515.1 hypothetical protein E4L95_16765 [Paracoccus liaowanqingii]
MSLSPDDFPDERLERRLHFLVSRADAHLSDLPDRETTEKDMPPRACAATLYRDAACVALLMDEVSEARDLLHKAGQNFLMLGLPVGASLLALSGTPGSEFELEQHADFIAGIRQQWRPREAHARDGGAFHTMADQARSEPRQLLAMMQADWIIDNRMRDRALRDESGPLREALERNGGYPVGATGLSIDSYARVADWFAERDGIEGFDDYLPDRIAALMATMMATRAEHLHSARKDRFHWKMLARPAEIVDLDATILMYFAINEDGTPKVNLDMVIDRRREEIPLLNAPIQIAKALKTTLAPEQYLQPF